MGVMTAGSTGGVWPFRCVVKLDVFRELYASCVQPRTRHVNVCLPPATVLMSNHAMHGDSLDRGFLGGDGRLMLSAQSGEADGLTG